MWILRVKDRGRDLAVHVMDRPEEAEDIRRVYELFGYSLDRMTIERTEPRREEAA